jgi:hypothetical protein
MRRTPYTMPGMYMSLWLVLLLAGFVSPEVSAGEVSTVLYVQSDHPMASDANDGSVDLPLKTIHRATQIAAAHHQQHVGTRIIIYPGIYRETITLALQAQPTDAAILLEAKEQGTVIISGADVWTGWQQQGHTNIYTHPWPYQWHMSANPWEREHIRLAPIVRRREMVFADGRALAQVLSVNALQDGTFYVAEEQSLLYIALPPEADIAHTIIEVSTREQLFAARDAKHVTLRGLIFQHASSQLDASAVSFFDAAHIQVEDCQFIWNNWSGLGFWNAEHIIVQRNVANHNGGAGMTAWKVHDLLFAENETSYNNWRGASGGFYGWDVAGIKNLRIHHGVYRRHKAVGNRARGFWLDYDNEAIHIEEAHLCQNWLDGVFIEASQGPVTITNRTICHNRKGAGILTTNSTAVTLQGNTVYDNHGPQIKVAGKSERQVSNWQTGQQMRLRTEEWTLRGNTLVGQRPGQLLIDIPKWEHFLQSLTTEGNLWSHPSRTQVFKVGQVALDFSGWQVLTGQDIGSRFAASVPTDLSCAPCIPRGRPGTRDTEAQ